MGVYAKMPRILKVMLSLCTPWRLLGEWRYTPTRF